MNRQNQCDVEMSEHADRRFHMTIAAATRNGALLKAIEMFRDARQSSAQTQHFLKKLRTTEVAPRIDEHTEILAALERRDPAAARAAMASHRCAVIEAALQATEIEAIEKTRAEIARHRQNYLAGSRHP
jgi:GntR family transcriptional repressor for pyruvate dehydrogenase complex